jgi:hypothetical protein
MELKIIATFYIIDEFFKAYGYKHHPQAKITDAEIVFVAVLAAYYCGGNFKKTLWLCRSNNYIKPLSESRFSRRLSNIKDEVWSMLFSLFNQVKERCFIVDSFPIPVIKNARISRAKIIDPEKNKGYCASKKEYFCGLKVHLVTSQTGIPIELFISSGSMHDIKALKHLTLNLPGQSILLADAAYTDYQLEERFKKERDITMVVKRKKNAKKAPLANNPNLYKKRKYIESVISAILSLTSRTIHAITQRGLELKLRLFVLAYAFFMTN